VLCPCIKKEYPEIQQWQEEDAVIHRSSVNTQTQCIVLVGNTKPAGIAGPSSVLEFCSSDEAFKNRKKGIGVVPVLPPISSILLTVGRNSRKRNQEHQFT